MSGLLQRLNWDELPKASLYALIGANMIPLLGVLFFGWRVGDVMLLFWLENVIIGGFNIVRMVIAAGGGILGFLMKAPVIAFFTVHYGGFTFVHGIFVIVMFVGVEQDGAILTLVGDEEQVVEITDDPETWPLGNEVEYEDGDFDELLAEFGALVQDHVLETGLWVALLALVISHGVSLKTNFIGSGEYRNVTADDLMMRPYGRVFVLHFVIIIGGMLVAATGQMVAAILLLVLLKIGLDVGAHMTERGRLGKRAGAITA